MQRNPNSLRIAHLSDPHFSHITYHPNQLLSKRWLGNLNLLLFRRNSYQTKHLWHIPELLDSLDVEAVFLTGDFSSTSLESEFAEGQKFIEAFQEEKLSPFFLPGNHDAYTRKAENNRTFYDYFYCPELKNERLFSTALGKNWWYIGLDCALATPLFCAYGHFSKRQESLLEERLNELPKEANVILANHFPLFRSKGPQHDLKRGKRLQALLRQYPQVKLYLHGHDHTPYIIDKQKEGLPLVLNSGSAAHKPDGTLYVVELFEHECLVERLLFRKEKEEFSWVIDWQKQFPFTR